MQGIFIIHCYHWHRHSLLFYKIFATTIFLSFKCFCSLFLYGIIDWMITIHPVRNMRRGQIGKSTYAMGVEASTHVRTMGEGDQVFSILARAF